MAYDKDIADRICTLLAETDKSLRKICAQEGLGLGVFLSWVNATPALAEQYARAREAKLDAMAEEIHEIADTPQVGVKIKTNEKGEREVTEGDMIEHRKLRIDARKWYLGKLAPKKYGDKLETTHKGTVGVTIATTPTDEAL